MPGGIRPPISVITSWPAANLENPTLRDNTLLVVIITFLVLSGLTVSARLWARGVIQRNLSLDDFMIIGALLCTISMTIVSVLAMAKYGFDRHVWDAFYLVHKLEAGRKMVLTMECSYILGTGLIKLSILFFVLRMTRSGSRWIVTSVWCTTVFVSLTTVIFFILPLSECRPFSAFWHQVNYKWVLADVKYSCLDEGARVLAAGVIAVIQDVMVATLPLSTVWGLQLPVHQKMMVTAIFGGGYLSCACGIMRVVYSYNTFYETYDVTWAAPHLFLWTNLELQVALICASIPALKVFFKHFKESTFRSRLSYSMDRYGTGKSHTSQGTPKSPGFCTQRLSSNIQDEIYATGDEFITVSETGTVSTEPASGCETPPSVAVPASPA